MKLTGDRTRTTDETAGLTHDSRPVLLATLEVPFDDEAAAFAVDAAVEAGQPLIVATIVEVPLGLCLLAGYGAIGPPEADAAKLRAPAELAHGLGVEVERLRVSTPHPVDALLELVSERRPGLLVFGPDRDRLKPRKLPQGGQEDAPTRAPCLVWLS